MESTRYQSRRLVLDRSPQDAPVQELASDQGWQRVEEVSEEDARQIVWAVAPGMALNYIEDPVSHNAYLVLVSDHRERVDEILEAIQQELMPWENRALLVSLDEARDPLSQARAVIRAGLGAPDEFDEAFFSRIRTSLSHSDKWVREAAVWATAYSPWPQYRPLLEMAAQNDPDEKIRSDAAAVLAGFNSEGVEGP
ncbi:HEAT repeat domain-containing protein [Streptomyces sp. NPDC005077]|uniref:HEAT repeat domain-containing protein n=1 Tax=unclassified Streptomyces TaxID=2593676 RepID=UPI0033A516C8